MCEKEFYTHKCYLNRGGGKFCSHKCYSQSRQDKPTWNKDLTKENNSSVQKISLAHKGKHYSPKTEFLKGFHPKTEWRKGIHPSPKTEFKKGHLPTPGSTNHHHTQKTKKLIAQANKGKIVSKETRHKLSIAQQKEKHWNWKGGITPQNIILRNSVEYKQWRKIIFQRDNYICQICNQKKHDLHAHHLFPFAKYPHLRFELANGITVCVECHKLIHSKK